MHVYGIEQDIDMDTLPERNGPCIARGRSRQTRLQCNRSTLQECSSDAERSRKRFMPRHGADTTRTDSHTILLRNSTSRHLLDMPCSHRPHHHRWPSAAVLERRWFVAGLAGDSPAEGSHPVVRHSRHRLGRPAGVAEDSSRPAQEGDLRSAVSPPLSEYPTSIGSSERMLAPL
ncbi:hypothetical protein BD626DRAFT_487988 [Schizophyllum amplum]|uniref:Uncharacterized protein n=1 Tax=Schizophyllum amplum TaxID=97359 RepID=A0A550CK97_9AGAR|nr:hypothetical protein BD626DRAFT_487988 [Auriculariopsis ampla]